MKDIFRENLDKFLIVFFFLIASGLWLIHQTPFTEGCVRDIVIAAIAYLTGKRTANLVTDSTQTVQSVTTVTPKSDIE